MSGSPRLLKLTVTLSAALAVAGVPACRGVRAPQGKGSTTAALPPPLDDPSATHGELEADLRAALLEAYAARSSGFDDAWLDLLTRAPRLLLVGVGTDDVIFGYSPGAAARNRPFPDRPAEWVSKALEVHVSADGSAGWSIDELSYRISDPRGRAILPLRETAVYERSAGRWEIVQEHLTYGAQLAEAARVIGRRLPVKRVGSRTGEGAASLRALLEPHLAGKATLPASERTVVLGPDAWRTFRGVEAPTGLAAVLGEEATFEPGELRVHRSRSGSLGWGAGTVIATSERYPNGVVLRVTWILEADGESWRLAVLHIGPVLARDALRTLVFGRG